MANTHETLTSLFSAIAAKIRTKTGTTDNIVADNFPDKIGDILTPADGSIPTKSVRDLVVNGAVVTTPAGYYPSPASKSVKRSGSTSTSLGVGEDGLVTAYISVGEGYTDKISKTWTYQIPSVQAAKTVVPDTSDKVAVASQTYTTGDITVKGDSNLKPENIASGVSIFGVTGTHESVTSKTSVNTVPIAAVLSNSNKTATFAWPTNHDWRNLCSVSYNTLVASSTTGSYLASADGAFLSQCILASMVGQNISSVAANSLVFTNGSGSFKYGGQGNANNTGEMISNANPALVVTADESQITLTLAGGSVISRASNPVIAISNLTFPDTAYLTLYYCE